MSEIQYTTLTDGTPVIGSYDTDGTPFLVKVEAWNGFRISTDGQDFINLDTTGGCCGDMTLPEWGRMKELASTNTVEQLVTIAGRFLASAPGPVEPPFDTEKHPGALEAWNALSRDLQIQFRPLFAHLNLLFQLLNPERKQQLWRAIEAACTNTLSSSDFVDLSERLIQEQIEHNQVARSAAAPTATP